MRGVAALERYLGSVGYETHRLREGSPQKPKRHCSVITISRQAGAGAHIVAEEMIARLQPRRSPGSPPWTIFDRNLVETVLRDHGLPDRLAAHMPEDRIGAIAEAMEDLFGLHPPTWTLVRKTADTILHLAAIGNVIVIGRGANLITASFDPAFHVRLVGSEPRRVAYVREHLHLESKAAARYVRDHDLGRARYVRTYYGKDIDDPLLYHLVINTDRVPYEEAARMIVEEVVLRTETSTGIVAPSRPPGRTVVGRGGA